MKVCFSDENYILDKNSIFLAGPTLRDSSFDLSWRKNACAILEKLGFDGIVYVPEYNHGIFSKEKVEKQALWERACLEAAGCILFWVPRNMDNMPALTTNVEFGTYLQRKPDNVILAYPDSAEKVWYLGWLYNLEKPGSPIYHHLEEALSMAVKNIEDNKYSKVERYLIDCISSDEDIAGYLNKNGFLDEVVSEYEDNLQFMDEVSAKDLAIDIAVSRYQNK